MIRHIIFLLFSFLTFSVKSEIRNEIPHLLNYVKTTNCQYERNSDKHSGEEAAKHIQKKYDYFKNDIKTAEDFIRLAATKSTFSGKHYKIHCPGLEPLKSQDWLLEELKKYRNNNN